MVVGLGEDEYFLASDIPAVLSHTKDVVFMGDGEMVIIRPDGPDFQDLEGNSIDKEQTRVPWDPIMAEKGGFKHFMLKEIHEQARAVRRFGAQTVRQMAVFGEVFTAAEALTLAADAGIDLARPVAERAVTIARETLGDAPVDVAIMVVDREGRILAETDND